MTPRDGASRKSYHSVRGGPAARDPLQSAAMRATSTFVRRSTPAAVLGVILAACGGAGDQAAHQVLHAIDQGKVIGTRGTMENVGKALASYALDHGGYPAGHSIEDASRALVPAFLPSPVTVDAWGQTFAYDSNGGSFTLTSPGADGKVGTADDTILSDGRFTQLPTSTGS